LADLLKWTLHQQRDKQCISGSDATAIVAWRIKQL